MTTWILTTGNTDVQLQNIENWSYLYLETEELNNFEEFWYSESRLEKYIKAPARVLGLMYANQPDYFGDLVFPKLDILANEMIDSEIKLDKIVIILTNQSLVYSDEEKQLMSCNYWKDTKTLKPLYKQYLSDKFPEVEIEFVTLMPTYEKLEDFTVAHQNLNFYLSEIEKKDIYISHESGLKSVSCCLQSLFKNATFLVGKPPMFINF